MASPHLKRFFERAFAGARLIYDHGCGYGGWTEYITSMTGAHAAVFDPDEQACIHTRKVLGTRLSNSEGPFDAIMCFGVLELLEEGDQVALMREFAAKLTGKLVVQYNFYNPLGLRWIAIRLRHGDPVKWHEANRFHRTYFKRTKVERMFRQAGFQIVEKIHPTIENHLPFSVNSMMGPFIPSLFQTTFYYSLEKV